MADITSQPLVRAIKSKLALKLASGFLFVVAFVYYPKWQQPQTEATISWDVSGYYFYLPSVFIYHDLKTFKFRHDILPKYYPAPGFGQAYEVSNGNYVLKYPMGMAILYSPWFFVAHIYALISDYPADGFSIPYQFMISLGSLIIACIGLLLLRILLLKYYPDGIVAVVLLTLIFATNYLDYTAINGAMTHNYLFTLYAILLLLTERYYRSGKRSFAIGIGLVLGLMALVRPTELMAVFLVLIWGIQLPVGKGLNERVTFLRVHWKDVILTVGIVCLMGSLQAMYWKYVSGDWIVYSYQDQGFSWMNPHLGDGLFSYNNGWLIYTPVMAISLFGIVLMILKRKKNAIPILLYTLLFIYVAFAWDIWWYGGSLGQRSMVQLYAVLAFPLAAMVQRLWKPVLLRGFLMIFLLFCTVYNLWLTHQAHKGGLLYAGQMTKAYFWEVVGTFKHDEKDLKLLDNPDMIDREPASKVLLKEEGFETDSSWLLCQSQPVAGEGSVCLNKDLQFSPKLSIPFQPGEFQWIRAEADFHCIQKEWDVWKMAQFILVVNNRGEVAKNTMIRVHRLLNDGETQRISVDLKLPEKPVDEIEVFVWNAGSDKALLMDNLEIYALEK